MQQILVIMFIKFCVWPLSCCKEIWFDQNVTLYIFSTENETHKRLNKLFIERISERTSNFVVKDQSIDDLSLKSAFQEIRPFMTNTSVAIHLTVEDFYKHNYNDILKLGFLFAGNIGEENELPVCRSETKNVTNVLERCQDSIEKQSNVKLVSETVINYSKLLEFITNFNEHDVYKSEITSPFKKPLVVGVCGLNDFVDDRMYLNKYYIEMVTNNNKVWWMTLDLTYAVDACKDSKSEGMIAVLTPEQFKPTDTFVTTTIFYDSQSLLPETKKMFRNSFVLLASTENLKFAFLKFIQERNWTRVAIISDDSETSKGFEEGITSLFRNANIVYASKSCDVSNCNFVEVFEPFVTAEPRLVIANIEEEYVLEFLQQMSKETQDMDLIWLFRVRSHQFAYATATWNISKVFTITLGPMIQQPYLLQECYSKPCNILSSLEALNEITHKFYDEIDQTRLTDEHFQRQFKKNITRYLYSGGSCKAYVHLNKEFNSDQPIAEMTISSSHEVTEYQEFHWNMPYFQPKLSDCTFKSDVYFKICDDMEVILLLLVVSVFSLTLLGIVFFFKSFNRYSRMPC